MHRPPELDPFFLGVIYIHSTPSFDIASVMLDVVEVVVVVVVGVVAEDDDDDGVFASPLLPALEPPFPPLVP